MYRLPVKDAMYSMLKVSIFDRAVYVASVRNNKGEEVLRFVQLVSRHVNTERRQAGKEISFNSLPLIMSSAHYAWPRDISRARPFGSFLILLELAPLLHKAGIPELFQ